MPDIEYFFGVGSPWAYLGLEPFLDLARRHDLKIAPLPIPLIPENGGIYSRERPEARRAYWFKDLRRWAEFRGKPLKLEGRAGLADPSPAGYVVLAAIREGQDWARLTKILQQAFWERGEDIGRTEIRRELLRSAGFDAEALEAKAQDEATQTAWRANLERARAVGVFGIPTWRFEGELYWGQDSLPFLERHLTASAAAHRAAEGEVAEKTFA